MLGYRDDVTEERVWVTAFLLTWKESGWPYENVVRMAEVIEQQGYVDEPWRLIAHNQAKPGDRVWVLKQGRGPKGIFATGELTGPPALGATGNGKTQWMAPVRFAAFVDPKKQLLVGEQETSKILRPQQISAQASGYPLDDAQAAALEAAFATTGVVELGGSGDWTQTEVRAIVSDYFAMLDEELADRPYSKTEHRNSLMQIVHRSKGSIERKHENISAVLRKLGLPWIDGYKPLPNFQDALVSEVEAQVPKRLHKLDQAPVKPPPAQVDLASLFVPPPKPAVRQAPALTRIVRKFDPAIRDVANRKLGLLGEEFALRIERERLTAMGRVDLARKVAHHSKDVGDGLGYDIASYTDDGTPIFIEVKTTRGPIETPFFVTENERRVAAEKGTSFRFYRIFEFGTKPRIFSLAGSLDKILSLEPVSYRARVAETKI